MQIIRRHCVPLHAVAIDRETAGGLKYTGGSALLWETMEGRFFATACHVWRGLMALVEKSVGKYILVRYDMEGILRIVTPILIDECEELDLAVFTFDGIDDFHPQGKAFLRTLNWPTAPAQSGEMIVGCGYPGDARFYRNGQWEQQIVFWAHKHCTVSNSGRRLLLDGQTGKGRASYFTSARPKKFGLAGISGAPLFVLRDTLDWVGIVRSGSGGPPNDYSIQATPSGFIGPDGRILKV